VTRRRGWTGGIVVMVFVASLWLRGQDAVADEAVAGVEHSTEKAALGRDAALDAVVALAGPRGLVCTGVLVRAHAILTARHCLPIHEVRFGRDPSSPSRVVKVRRTQVPDSPGIDLALLELEALATERAMPLRGARHDDPPVGTVRIVGFGVADPAGARGMGLRHEDVLRARGWGCSPRDEARTGCVAGVEMQIPRGSGRDTCTGDSGGPVLEVVDGRMRVVAITSRAVAGSLLRCGDGGIYTRVDATSTWLTRVLDGWEGKR
jgi:hypothetical protein